MTENVPSERSFGVSVGTVCLLLAAWLRWKQSETAWIAAGVIGLILVVFGQLAPSLLRGPNKVWWRIAHVLGWINSRIILGVFFFLVLTPAGFLMRIFGKHPLRGRRGSTNWNSYPARIANPHHFERLF